MTIHKTATLIATACSLALSALSADYYVNDAFTNGDTYCTAVGDDANTGRDPSSPKARTQAILDEYDLEPGDTIWIDTGTYTPPAGWSGHAVNIIASDSGAPGSFVTLQGSRNYLAGGTVLDRQDTYYSTVNLYCSVWVRVNSLRITGGGTGISAHKASNAVVEASEIFGNPGGGVWLRNCPDTHFRHTTIHDNGGRGLGFWEGNTSVFLEHCTIWSNHAGATPGGAPGGLPEIYYGDGTDLFSMTNTIVQASGAGHRVLHFSWFELLPYVGDYNDLSAVDGADFVSVGLSAIWNLAQWQAATTQDLHSLSVDACLTDDGHLKSTAGTWSNGTWLIRTTNSPCIDLGDPSMDFGSEPSPDGGRVNIGAFGNTPEASKSADSDGDRLPDTQESYVYGTDPMSADTDGDDYDDYSEVIAGTSPTNSLSVFDVTGQSTHSVEGFSLSWYGIADRTYTVMSGATPSAGGWTERPGLVDASGAPVTRLTGSNAWITVIDTNALGHNGLLYRVRVSTR